MILGVGYLHLWPETHVANGTIRLTISYFEHGKIFQASFPRWQKSVDYSLTREVQRQEILRKVRIP